MKAIGLYFNLAIQGESEACTVVSRLGIHWVGRRFDKGEV